MLRTSPTAAYANACDSETVASQSTKLEGNSRAVDIRGEDGNWVGSFLEAEKGT